MPKNVNRLDALRVDRARYDATKGKAGNQLSDGAGLFLFCTPNNAKSWRFQYRYPSGGKRHILVYGSYPDLSLAEARKRHGKARMQLADGINPAEERQRSIERNLQAQEIADAEKKNIFRTVAQEWYDEELQARPKSESWKCNVTRWLGWANEEFGSRPLPEIGAAEVLRLVKATAKEKPASAEWLRQTVSRVFAYGIRTLRAPKGFNPSEAIKGAIIVPDQEHHPKLTTKEIPAFFADLEKHDAPEAMKLGIKILLHCFPRKNELAGAPWTELDLDAALWTIDAKRMKMKREHKIPLSPQVVGYFRRLREIAPDSAFVFPSPFYSKKKPINGQGFNFLLNDMGYQDKLTPHGMRATAASALADAGFDVHVVDAQLAHQPTNKTTRAYFRNEYLEQRRTLLRAWSDMLDGFASGAKVIPIGNGKAA